MEKTRIAMLCKLQISQNSHFEHELFKRHIRRDGELFLSFSVTFAWAATLSCHFRSSIFFTNIIFRIFFVFRPYKMKHKSQTLTPTHRSFSHWPRYFLNWPRSFSHWHRSYSHQHRYFSHWHRSFSHWHRYFSHWHRYFSHWQIFLTLTDISHPQFQHYLFHQIQRNPTRNIDIHGESNLRIVILTFPMLVNSKAQNADRSISK